jgi:uncharacterized protein (TIGR03546 family)
MWARILSRCLPLVARLSRAAIQNSAPREIALAAALGAVIGLLPKANFFTLILLVLLFRLKVNIAAGLFSSVVFIVIGLGCEPFLHRTGFLVLTWKPLVPVWTFLYNLPLLPWTGFNQTLVIGALCAGAYLAWPVVVLTNWLVERYRVPVWNWLERHSWFAALLTSVRDHGRASP